MVERSVFLVTGGAGFIGSHICDALLAEGHLVVALDDLSTGSRANLSAGIELELLDIRSPEAAGLIESLKPKAILHHAAQMDVRRSTREPSFDADVNILGTLNLLQAASTAGVETFVFASTGGAIYGAQESHPATEDHPCRPLSPYGVAKLACEHYLYYFNREYGLDATCLRYANVYGERQNPHGEAGVVAIFLQRLIAEETPRINGDGSQTRDYIHVSDVVAANLAVLNLNGFNTFNVGTGQETSVLDLYREICRAAQIDRQPDHGPAMPGEQLRSSVDGRKLRKQLKLPTPLSLSEGLSRTAGWFRKVHEPISAKQRPAAHPLDST